MYQARKTQVKSTWFDEALFRDINEYKHTYQKKMAQAETAAEKREATQELQRKIAECRKAFLQKCIREDAWNLG